MPAYQRIDEFLRIVRATNPTYNRCQTSSLVPLVAVTSVVRPKSSRFRLTAGGRWHTFQKAFLATDGHGCTRISPIFAYRRSSVSIRGHLCFAVLALRYRE